MQKFKEGAHLLRNIYKNSREALSPTYARNQFIQGISAGVGELFKKSTWSYRAVSDIPPATIDGAWALLAQKVRYSELQSQELTTDMSRKIAAIGNVVNAVNSLGEKGFLNPYMQMAETMIPRIIFNNDLRRFAIETHAHDFFATMLTGALAMEIGGDISIIKDKDKALSMFLPLEKKLVDAISSHYGGLRRLSHKNLTLKDAIALYVDGSMSIPSVPPAKGLL